MYDLDQLRRDAPSRRAFLARMSAAGLGAAAFALLDGCDSSNKVSSTPGQTTGNPVVDATNFPGVTGRNINQAVLNYALTLERLEADLYRQALNAASGRSLDTALDTGNLVGNGLGNYALKVLPGSISDTNLQKAGFLYLVQFAYVEAAHRDFLTTALGSDAAPLTSKSGKYKFATTDGTPGTTLSAILANILPLEETGVRAYLGAGGFLTDNTLLQTAVSIYSTECRHSASIEYILGLDPGPNVGITGVPAGETNVPQVAQLAPNNPVNDFEKALTPKTVLTAAASVYFA